MLRYQIKRILDLDTGVSFDMSSSRRSSDRDLRHYSSRQHIDGTNDVIMNKVDTFFTYAALLFW